jgi:hypothetical protein
MPVPPVTSTLIPMYSSNPFATAPPDPAPGRPPVGHRLAFWLVTGLLALLALSAALWAFGQVLALAGFLVRVALATAVVALVWRRVARGRWRPPSA